MSESSHNLEDHYLAHGVRDDVTPWQACGPAIGPLGHESVPAVIE